MPKGTRTLVAIGGGTLLDEAKALAREFQLVAIPTVWGSGAEVSPVVVLNRGGCKEIHMGDEYVPDARVIWPELAATLSETRAKEACGDAWSHALEGFLSPLATDELRGEGAALMREMLAVGVGNDPRWFELSARACALQARSSVGLIHGIAHTLEPAMPGWGHARLCATFFKPVLAFDRRSEKVAALLAELDLDRVADALFDRERYAEALRVLPEQWPNVLRDRCTRTNAVLVRPGDVSFFTGFEA